MSKQHTSTATGEGLIRRIYRRRAPAAVLDPTHPRHWQEKILYLFILIVVSAGSIVYLLCAYSNMERGWWLILGASTLGYLCSLVIFFFPRSPFVFRAGLACSFIYFIGMSIVLTVGPFYASREWLFAFALVAVILLGWTGALAAVSVSIATWILIAYLIQVEYWSTDLVGDGGLHYWTMISLDLALILLGTVILITVFFKRIGESDRSARRSSELLLAEKNKLAREIEDRKSMADALRESEERYRTILETIEDAYFETDLRGRLTFFNRAMTEQLGYDKNELMGMQYRTYLDKQNARKLFRVLAQLHRDNLSGRLPVDVEVLSRHRGVRTVNILLSLVRDGDGRPRGFRGVARDITEHAIIENRLQQAQKMEAIGALAGGVAHDLNNTLSGVVSYPQVLLSTMDESDPLHRPLTAIMKSGEKAAAIVQDLLTLSRRGVAITEATNLNVLVRDYLQSPEFQSLQALYPHVTIESQLDPDLLNTIGSPVHLGKMVMNLLINAFEAIPDEGMVTISTENRHIDSADPALITLERGDYVVLTVRDTGKGIPPRDLDKIFEPFFSRKARGRSGTGLGMAVVWGTVQDHGGHVEVKSSLKRGTTFTVYLPATRESIKEVRDIPVQQYLGQGETILIVDDIESQRDIAREMLESLGYETVEAKIGVEAVRYMKTNSADLVLLDMIMRPGIDGLETYRQIINLHPGQKAVIVSGYSETVRVREAQQLGVGAYVKKPYSIETLGMAIRKELARDR